MSFPTYHSLSLKIVWNIQIYKSDRIERTINNENDNENDNNNNNTNKYTNKYDND